MRNGAALRLASGDAEGRVVVWDISSSTPVLILEDPLHTASGAKSERGKGGAVRGLAWVMANPVHLAIVLASGNFLVWDVNGGPPFRRSFTSSSSLLLQEATASTKTAPLSEGSNHLGGHCRLKCLWEGQSPRHWDHDLGIREDTRNPSSPTGLQRGPGVACAGNKCLWKKDFGGEAALLAVRVDPTDARRLVLCGQKGSLIVLKLLKLARDRVEQQQYKVHALWAHARLPDHRPFWLHALKYCASSRVKVHAEMECGRCTVA